MSQPTAFPYFYGSESEQFSFFRIPRQLLTGTQFKNLSTDAKLLYGLLLDRMSLSAKNGWYDEQGRVYIYYSLDEIQEDMNCAHGKAVKLLAELDTGKGIGLIERQKQGQGRPAKIFVKRFATTDIPETPPPPEEPEKSRLPIFGSQDFSKTEVKSSEKQKSRLPIIGSADFSKSEPNYTDNIYTEISYTDPSTHPSGFPVLAPGMDRRDCTEQVKENICYDLLKEEYRYDDVDELLELIVDVLTSTRSTFRIGGEDVPAYTVKDRFWRLDREHIVYVFDSLQKNTTEIRNIRGYLLTALYNAPVTIGHYYKAAVQHDLYGQ